jgi:ribonuclease BN (tRNA processing enzyme)
MRVTDEFGRSIVYGADTGTIEPLIDFAAGADILIAEATLDEDDTTPPDKRGHLTPSLAGQLASKCGVETLVLTHLWAERPTEDVVRDASAAFSGRIEVARPGLRIDV